MFCRIIAGELPSSKLYEDDNVIAFMDIQPATEGHLLVIPKDHAPLLADLDPDDAGHMMVVAQKMAAALRASSIPTDGVNLFLADGEVAGQEVPHAHLHVLPRTKGDGFGLTQSPTTPGRQDLDNQAAAIKKAMDPAAG